MGLEVWGKTQSTGTIPLSQKQAASSWPSRASPKSSKCRPSRPRAACTASQPPRPPGAPLEAPQGGVPSDIDRPTGTA
eukprot:905682-Pyramimonas_sp.AAC.1